MKGPAGSASGSLVRDIPIRLVVVLSLLLAGLLPMLVVTLLSLGTGANALRQRALLQLESVRSNKAAQLTRYFGERTNDVELLAANPFVGAALRELCGAFREHGASSGQRFRGEDARAYSAPDAYIKIHDHYYPFLAGIIDRYNYYDLFLIDARSREVCFTVEKEADFGRGVGPDLYGLQVVVDAAISNKAGFLSDTMLYPPSRYAAAQFVAAPLLDADGQVLGVVALQIGMEGIDEIMNDRTGMGETGETFLVGPDFRMRSDSHVEPERYSVSASFRSPLEVSGVETAAVKGALGGEDGTSSGLNHRGINTLTAFGPVEIGDFTWALIAEIHDSEVQADIDHAFNRQIIIVVLMTVLASIVVGWLVARFVLSAISRIRHAAGALKAGVHSGNLFTLTAPEEQATDFRPVVQSINELVKAFVSILDMMPTPIVIIDAGRKVTFANASFASLAGCPASELIGLDYGELALLCGLVHAAEPESRDGSEAPILTALATGRHVSGSCSSRVCDNSRQSVSDRRPECVQDSDAGPCSGSGCSAVRHFLSSAAPVKGDGGEVSGAVEVLSDQTEALRVAAENVELCEQIHRGHRLDYLGTLASGIAHDFNNILAYMLVYLDIARRHEGEKPDIKVPLERLGEGIERASGLVRQILDFSSSASREASVIDIGETVEKTIELARASLPGGVSLHTTIESGIKVHAEAGHIQQIVMNLFTNAWQAMPEGGVLTVAVAQAESQANDSGGGSGAQARMATLIVSDTGVGIPPELQHRVFEPFFTGKAPGRGTGLGLSVVHGIVKRLGGTICLQSQPAAGTSVIVTMPVCPSATEGTPS